MEVSKGELIKMKIRYYNFETPIGKMSMCITEKGILYLSIKTENDFVELNKKYGQVIRAKEESCQYQKEIMEYFNGERKKFSLPLDLRGTDFQIRVWKELLTIPYGNTVTYKEIAYAIGKPKACRAVGNALNKNPILIVVPCHRVIGSNGKLVGFGCGLELKRKLLNFESQYIL